MSCDDIINKCVTIVIAMNNDICELIQYFV